ncbi:MAG: ROK family transcriptional regulator [Oscillospiraceae bacterium]|nr:ROK family transcriptional regulator [Oscillospiraceae bacterium]
MLPQGMDRLNTKRRNRAQILRLLKRSGPCSRMEIAKKLSLTTATISTLTADMLSQGLLYECAEQTGGTHPGKKGMLLDIQYNRYKTLGCIIGDDSLRCGIADLRGNILHTGARIDFDQSSAKSILAATQRAIDSLLRWADPAMLGIGIGVNNELLQMTEIGDDLLTALRAEMSTRYASVCGVKVDISSRALALAQVDYDQRNPGDSIVFLQVANSLDMAVTIGGELYSGAHGNLGKLDHMVIDPDGELCECGKRGCVRTVLTVNGLLNRVKKIYSRETTPVLYEITGGDKDKLQYDHLKIAAKRGDKIISEIYEKDDARFSSLLYNFLTLIDPNKCFIQGIGLYANEFIERLNKVACANYGKKFSDIYALSFLNADNIFLGGNALAGRAFFYETGGPEKHMDMKLV